MKVAEFIKELTDRFDENYEISFSTYTEISRSPVAVTIFSYGGNRFTKIANVTFGSDEFTRL